MKMLHHFARYVTRHRRAALVSIANRLEQLFRRAGLYQVTIGAGFQSSKNPLAVLINRNHDDLHFGPDLLDFSDALDAGNTWQFDVHEDDVGVLFENAWHRQLGGSKCAQGPYVR